MAMFPKGWKVSCSFEEVEEESSNGHRPPNPPLRSSSPQASSPAVPPRVVAFGRTLNFPTSITIVAPYSPWSGQKDSLKSEGIRAGEIIGHRAWLVDHYGHLCSSNDMGIWQKNEPKTGDVTDYGVFACKERDQLKLPAMELLHFVEMPSYPIIALVIGTVDLWGEIIEHEIGYRAENAAIRSIDWVIEAERFEEIEKKIRENYGKLVSSPLFQMEIAIRDMPDSNGLYSLATLEWHPL